MSQDNRQLATVTDEEIAEAFKGTNFGQMRHRDLLEQGCLKRVAGYCQGHTLTMIMRKLGLTTEKDSLTKKGRMFLFYAFYDKHNSG